MEQEIVLYFLPALTQPEVLDRDRKNVSLTH